MANFPASLDNGTTLPTPSAGNFTNNPSHATMHGNENSAIIAVETKVGIGAATPVANRLLTGTGTGTSDWSKVSPAGTIVGTTDSQTLTNKTLTSPTINAPTITNATLTTDAITGFTTSTNGTVYGISVTGGVLGSAALVNAVNTAAIQNGAVTSTQIATNGVSAANLATNAITLGYAQITTTFSTASASAVQVTGLTTTVTIPAGGRKIKITFWCKGVTNNTNATSNFVTIWDGVVGSGTQLSQLQTDNTTAAYVYQVMAMAVVTPSAGSKTYNIGLNVNSGTSTINALTTSPAFILVEAI